MNLCVFDLFHASKAWCVIMNLSSKFLHRDTISIGSWWIDQIYKSWSGLRDYQQVDMNIGAGRRSS